MSPLSLKSPSTPQCDSEAEDPVEDDGITRLEQKERERQAMYNAANSSSICFQAPQTPPEADDNLERVAGASFPDYVQGNPNDPDDAEVQAYLLQADTEREETEFAKAPGVEVHTDATMTEEQDSSGSPQVRYLLQVDIERQEAELQKAMQDAVASDTVKQDEKDCSCKSLS